MRRPLHTERGYDRLINFSDAIVAIAITLLVLPMIDILSDEGATEFWGNLSQHSNTITGFLIAFAVMAGFWQIHHSTFEYIGAYDRWLMRFNFVWLMVIVLLPFVSAAYSESQRSEESFVLFALALAALSLIMGVITEWVRRHPELQGEGVEPTDLITIRPWIFTGYLLLLTGVSALGPGQHAAWGLVGLVFLNWYASHWHDRRYSPSDA